MNDGVIREDPENLGEVGKLLAPLGAARWAACRRARERLEREGGGSPFEGPEQCSSIDASTYYHIRVINRESELDVRVRPQPGRTLRFPAAAEAPAAVDRSRPAADVESR